MGKVLHASYSGYFPFCTEQGTPSSSKEYLSLTLLEAMTLFWRVKRWELKVNGELNVNDTTSGVEKITYDNEEFFECEATGTSIATEEDFVCVQDADSFLFTTVGRLNELLTFRSGLTILNTFQGSFILVFTTLDERIITNGSNFFVNFFSGFGSGVTTKDEDRHPNNTTIVGSYSISFGGFTKSGELFGPEGQFSGNMSLQIRVKEYWSYGGTYNTETGQPL